MGADNEDTVSMAQESGVAGTACCLFLPSAAEQAGSVGGAVAAISCTQGKAVEEGEG